MNPIRSCFSFSILFLLTISFSSKNAASGQPLAKLCIDIYNPVVDTGYAANLNSLLSSLSSNANSSSNNNNYDYYNSTAGFGRANAVYGLYLCRGDVNKTDCETCVQTASREILTECPNNKTAIVWYDDCMLRYSNHTHFPVDHVEWYMWNMQNSTDPERFNEYVTNMMNELAIQASSDVSGEKFAVQEGNFSAIQRLFSLAQCIPDLSSTDCDTCLRETISLLPNCCNGKLGGRVLAPNCNIRYEINRFYNVVPQPPSPAPAPVLGFRVPPTSNVALQPPSPAPAPVLSFRVPPPTSNITLTPPPKSNSPDKGGVQLFRYVVFFMYLFIYVGMP